jgi:MFS family permease
MAGTSRATVLLLNVAHALDHLVLLVFATAVVAIAAEFGMARWEDLMPYATGAFLLFGLGSLPSGRLGDLWGRRRMMLVFFFGIGVASCFAAAAQSALQLGAALVLLGAFASIYHPVGIPMLVERTDRPGAVIGVNGLAGNLGVAAAAVVTGALVKWIGWRAAFAFPGLVSIACGIAFARLCPHETEPPAGRVRKAAVSLDGGDLARAFAVMTAAAITGSLLFNFTTNGNGPLLAERLTGIVTDPALLGALLALVYVVGSLAQLVVGRLIDRVALKPLFLSIVLAQVPVLLLASQAQGWAFFALLVLTMTLVFGAIPFTDAMIVRYVDDRMRSRVSGMRLAVSFGVSSAAVWALGPVVKSAGFDALLIGMAGVAALTAIVVLWLPRERGAAAVVAAGPSG